MMDKQLTSELVVATKRRTPLCSQRVCLSACVGLVATLATCLYSSYRIRQGNVDFKALQRSQLSDTGNQLMSGIRRQLETSVSSTKALSALIHLDQGAGLMEPLAADVARLGQVTRSIATAADASPEELEELEALKAQAKRDIIWNSSSFNFNIVADSLKDTYKGITNLQLAPAGIVSVVHPMADHSGAIGHDLFFDPARREGAMKAIQRRGIVFVGPLTLMQNGKRAIIARNPTYVTKPGFVGPVPELPTWWGFTTMLCELDDLFAPTPLGSAEVFHISYVLFAKTSGGAKFLRASEDQKADNAVDDGTSAPEWLTRTAVHDPVVVEFILSDLNVHWVMYLWPKAGWQLHSSNFVLQVMLCTFFTVCSLVSMYSVLVRESVIQQVSGIIEQSTAKGAWLDNSQQSIIPVPPPLQKPPGAAEP